MAPFLLRFALYVITFLAEVGILPFVVKAFNNWSAVCYNSSSWTCDLWLRLALVMSLLVVAVLTFFFGPQFAAIPIEKKWPMLKY